MYLVTFENRTIGEAKIYSPLELRFLGELTSIQGCGIANMTICINCKHETTGNMAKVCTARLLSEEHTWAIGRYKGSKGN